MIEVSPFEGRVLVAARAVTGATDWEHALPLLATPCPASNALSPNAIRLLDRTMAVGLPLALARRGGWHAARFLGEGGEPEPVALRGWQRSAPPFELSRAASGWILALASGLAEGPRVRLEPPATPADELVLYLLAGGLEPLEQRGHPVPWITQICAAGTLAWMGHADSLAGSLSPPSDRKRWAAWAAPPAVRIAEALQPDFARRMVAIERAKNAISDPARMVALGSAQEAVLTSWFDACDEGGRRDLARFALEAAARLCARPRPARAWTGSLPTTGTLEARQSARRAAGAFLRALERPARWDREHRAHRHFDPGHAAAQLLLRDFEALGPARLAHARAATDELERPPTAEA